MAAEDDPAKFARPFDFAGQFAHQAHGTSDAARNPKPPVGGARRTLSCVPQYAAAPLKQPAP